MDNTSSILEVIKKIEEISPPSAISKSTCPDRSTYFVEVGDQAIIPHIVKFLQRREPKLFCLEAPRPAFLYKVGRSVSHQSTESEFQRILEEGVLFRTAGGAEAQERIKEVQELNKPGFSVCYVVYQPAFNSDRASCTYAIPGLSLELNTLQFGGKIAYISQLCIGYCASVGDYRKMAVEGWDAVPEEQKYNDKLSSGDKAVGQQGPNGHLIFVPVMKEDF